MVAVAARVPWKKVILRPSLAGAVVHTIPGYSWLGKVLLEVKGLMAVASTLVRFGLWGLLLLATIRLWSEDPFQYAQSRTPEGVSIIPDVVYGSDDFPSRHLTIIAPSMSDRGQGSRRKCGAILAIHGGSWIGGSRREFAPQLTRLAGHGYAVFVADYSLARPGRPSWPAALEDLRQAVRWIVANAERYRADPHRLAILGSGSGGHLALMLAFDPDLNRPREEGGDSPIRAVISLYGPTDLEALVQGRDLVNEPARVFLGTEEEGWPRRAALASPIAHVRSTSPPTMLIQGLDDLYVPTEQARRLDRALGEENVIRRLLLLPSARHGFELQLGGPSRLDLLPDILDFLDAVSHN